MPFEACGKGVFPAEKSQLEREDWRGKVAYGACWRFTVGLDVYAEGFGEFFDFCEFEDEVSAFVCEFVDCFTVFFFFLD